MNDLGIGALKEQLAKLASMRVTIGYQGETGAEPHPGAKDASVATVAHWQEYGTKYAPARPLGKHTMEQNREAFARAAERAVVDLVDGRLDTAEAAGEQLGRVGLTALRKTIDTSREWAEANAESTIAAKGHDQPLIGEHAKLYSNASYAVRDGDRIVVQSESTGDD